MSPGDAVVWSIGYALVCVTFWWIVSALRAFLGGWHSLARRYPATEMTVTGEVRYSTGMVGLARYVCELTVSVGPAGVGMRLSLPIQVFHPGIFLPWFAITRFEQGRRLWRGDHVRLEVGLDLQPIRFEGRAARLVGAAWLAWQASSTRPAA